jgi:endonuclease/exonuclease/phosphatase family metal-dependent hydrolase
LFRWDRDLWEQSGHNPALMLGIIDQGTLQAAASDKGFLAHLNRVSNDFADRMGREYQRHTLYQEADLKRSRTYPGLLPLMHLDHIYFDETLELEHAKLHRSRASLLASDHLPIFADFRAR